MNDTSPDGRWDPAPPERVRELADDLISTVTSRVSGARDAVTAALTNGSTLHTDVADVDWSTLDDACRTGLSSAPDVIQGMGFVADPSLFSSEPYFLSWWVVDDRRRIVPAVHDTDPSHESFYEYSDLDWFAGPKAGRASVVSGPCVDYGCTNDYTLTVAAAALAGGRFVGVAGADVPVSLVERFLHSALRVVPAPCLLVNAERRIIASNCATMPPGAIAPAEPGSWFDIPCANAEWFVTSRVPA